MSVDVRPSTVGSPAPAADVPGSLPVGSRRERRWIDVAGPAIGFALFVGLWWLMHAWGMRALFDKPSFLLPSPATVVDRSYLDAGVRGDMLQAVWWTAGVALTGLAVSIVLGMSIAVVMAQANWVERSVWPYLIAAQSIPILAIAPLIGNIFGFGFGSRVLVCVMISIFPIVSNTLFGLLSAEPSQHDLFTLKSASRWTRLTKLQVPSALPAIFTGFRIAAGLSVIGAVVGELFFRVGGKGIGIVMEQYRSRAQWPQAYGALVLSISLGIVVFVFFGWLSRLVIGRWHETTR